VGGWKRGAIARGRGGTAEGASRSKERGDCKGEKKKSGGVREKLIGKGGGERNHKHEGPRKGEL